MLSERENFDPRKLAGLQGLELRARHIVDGYLSGRHRGAHRGYAVEFAEHRDYAPGDDLRYLDWKAFGKTDRLYLKQHEEETSLYCYLLVDTSASMAYQGPGAPLSKWEFAQCLAIALAYVVLSQQDQVALALFDHRISQWVPASSHPAQLKRLIDLLDNSSPRGESDLPTAMRQFARQSKKRGVVFVISDLFGNIPAISAGLKHLRFKRHDVTALHILDPAEIEFPFDRAAKFVDLELGQGTVVDPLEVRTSYRREVETYLSTVKESLRAARLDYVLLRTDEPFDTPVAELFATRGS